MIVKSPYLRKPQTPSVQLLRELIDELTEQEEDAFLVMEDGSNRFIQAYWTPKGFDLEYQEEGERHFAAVEPMSPTETIERFLRYGCRDRNWRQGVVFVRLVYDPETQRWVLAPEERIVWKSRPYPIIVGKVLRWMGSK
mgnify:CR=1 FL=1